VAQQQGSQLAGQAPPQQAALLVAGAGAKSAASNRTKYNMETLLRNLME
jgi:hypothetical protein